MCVCVCVCVCVCLCVCVSVRVFECVVNNTYSRAAFYTGSLI